MKRRLSNTELATYIRDNWQVKAVHVTDTKVTITPAVDDMGPMDSLLEWLEGRKLVIDDSVDTVENCRAFSCLS